MAKAFEIGKGEASAVFELLQKVPPTIAEKLENSVRTRGMARLLNHDVIGKGTFSLGYSSAAGSLDAWTEALTNQACFLACDVCELHVLKSKVDSPKQFLSTKVNLYLDRLIAEHDSSPLEMRQAWTLRTATKNHQACGAFVFCLEKLEAIIPEGSWDEAKKNLCSQFMLGLLDGDLLHMLETCVPESDAISCVGPVRHSE